MIISNNINCIGSCLPNLAVEKNNIKYTKDNLKKIALTDDNGKSINIGILTNEITNDIDLRQLYASANYSISNEVGYAGFNFGEEFNFGKVTESNSSVSLGIPLPINSTKLSSSTVQSSVKTEQITEGIGCAKISLGKDENDEEITRFILPAHGVIQLDDGRYATTDENGNVTLGSVILNADDHSVSPLGKSSFKIGNLSWEFNSKDLIKIKYNDDTWFSLRVITATAELIEGLCSEVPTPELKLNSANSFEFPITPGQTFNLDCTYSLDPIFDWFNELCAKIGKESLPEDYAKMGKFILKSVQALDLSEAWEILAKAFNAGLKLISFPLRHPILTINISILDLMYDKPYKEPTLLLVAFLDVFCEIIEILTRIILFIGNIFVSYYGQTLLVEKTDISNLLFSSAAFINKSVYPDGSDIIISENEKTFSIPNHMDTDDLGNQHNQIYNSLLASLKDGLGEVNLEEYITSDSVVKFLTDMEKETQRWTQLPYYVFNKTFIWNVTCETSDNPDELNTTLNSWKTNDLDDEETLEFESSYKYLDIEPVEVNVKIILPEITVNDITINYMINGEEFTKELTAELNSDYSKEYLEFTTDEELPKGLTLDSNGKLHGIIEKEFKQGLFNTNTTDIIVKYPGAEDQELTITWELQSSTLTVSGLTGEYSPFNGTYEIERETDHDLTAFKPYNEKGGFALDVSWTNGSGDGVVSHLEIRQEIGPADEVGIPQAVLITDYNSKTSPYGTWENDYHSITVTRN